MDHLRRLASWVRGFCIRESPSSPGGSSTPDALSASILDKLPLELLLYTVDYLPSESAAAFSLSCKEYKRLFGAQHFSAVASFPESTFALLRLLAIDIPDQIACYPYLRLHSVGNLTRYTGSICTFNGAALPPKALPACVVMDWEYNTILISNLFGMTACKMAIKRNRRRPDCRELLNMMSSKATEITLTGYFVRQSREECRVVQGHLMHRLQSVYFTVTPISFQRNAPFQIIFHISIFEPPPTS
jgi:hypothetical protein